MQNEADEATAHEDAETDAWLKMARRARKSWTAENAYGGANEEHARPEPDPLTPEQLAALVVELDELHEAYKAACARYDAGGHTQLHAKVDELPYNKALRNAWPPLRAALREKDERIHQIEACDARKLSDLVRTEAERDELQRRFDVLAETLNECRSELGEVAEERDTALKRVAELEAVSKEYVTETDELLDEHRVTFDAYADRVAELERALAEYGKQIQSIGGLMQGDALPAAQEPGEEGEPGGLTITTD